MCVCVCVYRSQENNFDLLQIRQINAELHESLTR